MNNSSFILLCVLLFFGDMADNIKLATQRKIKELLSETHSAAVCMYVSETPL